MVIVGIDEVGRGCWAGPLVAAAVALDESVDIPGLNDSKKLSKLQRERLVTVIEEKARAIGIGWVWPETIDAGGITQAVKSAMTQAFEQIGGSYDRVIIDGNINYLADHHALIGPSSKDVEAIIKADGSVAAVSAASIIAKVARDNYMAGVAETYPGYGFELHVGYGTKAHIEALSRLGVTEIHRRSYKPIKALLELN